MFKSYDELKDRIITYNPHRTKRIISYGVIAICKLDESVLIIQRKYSPNFINFIKGWYRKSQLVDLFKEMTEKEIISIKKIMYKPERFIALYNNVSPDGDASYATSRFEDNQQRIWDLCNTMPGVIETEWLLPKGKIEYTDKTVIDCAKREFIEESGISYIPQYPLSDSPVTFYNHSATGFIYETKLWIFVFDEKLPILHDTNNFEILDRRWVKRYDLHKYFDAYKMSIINEAFRVYQSNKTSQSKNSDII